MYDHSSPFRASTSPIPAKLKTDFAETRLRDAVLWCELAPGETVSEQALAERFGLARAAVRTALARLAGEAWIVPLPRKGWRVRPVTSALIRDVVAARRLLEPALAEARPDEREMRRIAELADIAATLLGRPEDNALRAGRLYDRELMELLAARANSLLAGWLHETWNHADRIVRFVERHGTRRLPLSDRADLVTALAEGDPETVVRHLQAATDAFEQFVAVSLLSIETQFGTDDPFRQSRKKTRGTATAGLPAARRNPTEEGWGTKS